MFLMRSSSSMVQSFNLISLESRSRTSSFSFFFSAAQPNSGTSFVGGGKRRIRIRRLGLGVFVPNAKEKRRRQSWWYKFFLDDDGNWLGLKENDMLDLEDQMEEMEDNKDDDSKFEAWKARAEAITELRQAQEDIRNQESRSWEDWLAQGNGNGNGSTDSAQDWEWNDANNVNNGNNGNNGNGLPPQPFDPPNDMIPDRGLVRSVRNFLLGREDDDEGDDLLYQDRVFRYASINSAKFLVVLIIVPWALDFVLHDYLLMPFLDRYVKTVPLAAQMLDVRRNQKLEIVDQLKMEKARLRLEVEIGKTPPLSDDQLWWQLRDKALELREERRLQNRAAFANIWSDMVFGISLFILLYCNQSKVALLKFTGYKIINNISDTGKAFLIILITDIFLGYHSESGWQTLVEIIVEHYGLEVDQSAITFFICFVPVIIDACVKLWLFKFLPRLSPKVANIFREMKRH